MKKCSYCGRENPMEAEHCQECGTKLVEVSVDATPIESRDLTWLEGFRHGLWYALAFVFIIALYLLSFGPVARYCGKTVPMPPMPAAPAVTNSQTVTTTTVAVRAVRYPRWIVVYYPAFILRSASGPNGLYNRYIEWWESSGRD